MGELTLGRGGGKLRRLGTQVYSTIGHHKCWNNLTEKERASTDTHGRTERERERQRDRRGCRIHCCNTENRRDEIAKPQLLYVPCRNWLNPAALITPRTLWVSHPRLGASVDAELAAGVEDIDACGGKEQRGKVDRNR